MAGPLQLVDDPECGLTRWRAVVAITPGDDDQQLHVALVELVGEQLCCAGRLRVRVSEAARREVLGTGTPKMPIATMTRIAIATT